MTLQIKQAVYSTISYADVFDYPLSAYEIWYWCIGGKFNLDEVERSLIVLSGVKKANAWFMLSGRKKNIQTRLARFSPSVQKYLIATKICRFLANIPTILMIGITGGTAIHNASAEDDVDIFIVTKYGTLWITRFICLVILEIFGVRRKAREQEIPNSICLNMLADEGSLRLTSVDQDLYNAHEILQIQPIYNLNNTYLQILQSNKWIEQLLPNAWAQMMKLHSNTIDQIEHINSQRKYLSDFISWCMYYLEPIFWKIQTWYMRRLQTIEIVTPHIARFHPRDTRGYVMNEFEKRLARLKIPLDKKFIWTLK